jgi:hypothetical protein
VREKSIPDHPADRSARNSDAASDREPQKPPAGTSVSPAPINLGSDRTSIRMTSGSTLNPYGSMPIGISLSDRYQDWYLPILIPLVSADPQSLRISLRLTSWYSVTSYRYQLVSPLGDRSFHSLSPWERSRISRSLPDRDTPLGVTSLGRSLGISLVPRLLLSGWGRNPTPPEGGDPPFCTPRGESPA